MRVQGVGGGTVGDRIRGLGVSGRGGGVLGDPYHMGGGGGVATRNTGPYIYIYIYIHTYLHIHFVNALSCSPASLVLGTVFWFALRCDVCLSE